MHRVGLIVCIPALVACAAAPVRQAEPAPERESFIAQPLPGAIWQSGSEGLALFGDAKARQVGDVLTVILGERTQAKSSASTSLSKNDSAQIAPPTLFGRPVTADGIEVLSGELSAEREFSGSGDTSQSNQLSGNVTVTVVERLANGNLRIRGEKLLKLNQGDETIRVEGVVRPVDIAPDNTVASSRIAEARIAYAGEGSLGDANAQGWLSRLLGSRWMPF